MRDSVDLGFKHGSDEESSMREMVGLREVKKGLLFGEGERREKGTGLSCEWGRGALERGAREGAVVVVVVSGEEWFEGGVEREGKREGLGWRCHGLIQ